MPTISTPTIAAVLALAVANPVAAQDALNGGGPRPQAVGASPNPELIYEPVTGCRVLDTQASSALSAARSFTISGAGNLRSQGGPKGGCGVPLSAAAVSIYLTTSDASQSGSIAAYPSGLPATHIAAASYAPGLQLTSGGVVAINNHQLTLAPTAGSVQVAADVTGYYAPQIAGFFNGDGSIYSATVRILSSSRDGTGLYTIVIDRDVSRCAVNATTNEGNVFAAGYGEAGNSVVVGTVAVSGGSTIQVNSGFNLAVTC